MKEAKNDDTSSTKQQMPSQYSKGNTASQQHEQQLQAFLSSTQKDSSEDEDINANTIQIVVKWHLVHL